MTYRNIYILPFVVILLFVFSLPVLAETGVVKTRLGNGLTVILEENHSAPVVAFQMWVNVGSADEKAGEEGIAHVLEHMLFKGTAKRGVGDIAREVEGAGGYINAYTSNDITVYHLALAGRYFDTGLDIISDAIQNSAFDPGELEKELEVVLEEVRMGEDSPERRLYKDLLSTAYAVHPYGKPMIGNIESVKGLTREGILTFLKKWYRPTNMTLVVVGAFDRYEALWKIKESFKDFSDQKRFLLERPVEPSQDRVRLSLSQMDIKGVKLVLGFHIPAIDNPDIYSLDVLSYILGHGKTSRFYKRLRDKEHILHAISAYAMTLKDSGLFLVNADLDVGRIGDTLRGVIDEIGRVRYSGVTDSELERATLALESEFIYEREMMKGRARQLGYSDVIAGDLKFEDKYIEGIAGVGSEDIKRVVDTYLREGNMTLAVISPEAEEAAEGADTLKEVISMSFEDAKGKYLDKERADDILKVQLENGVTLIVKEDQATPIVSVYTAFPGGLRFEDKESNGLGNFVAQMITRGTETRTAEVFAKEVEDIAAEISGFSGRNTVGMRATFLSRYFDKGMELLADALLNPVFPEEEMENVRKDVLATIERQENNLPRYAFKLMHEELYKKHPYGMAVSGTKDAVERFTREDVLSRYKGLIVPGQMVIAIVGAVEKDKAISEVKELFGRFDRKTITFQSPPAEERQTRKRITGANKASNQTNIAIGFLGATIDDNDKYALSVLSEILSAQGGRLFVNLRDKSSLAYAVSAFSRPGVEPGVLSFYIGTAPEKKAEAVEGVLGELKKVVENQVTAQELERAKKAIIGAYEMGLQRKSAQASNMANNELLGVGYEEWKRYPEMISKVTSDDVLEVAKQYIDLDAYTISIVGPEVVENDNNSSQVTVTR